MSGAIIANALLFQERIANNREEEDIPLLQFLFCQYGKSPKQEALAAWKKILDINYWPIFKTASQIIELLDTATTSKILEKLADEAMNIRSQELPYENNLTGHVFQKLIVDRLKKNK